jgi:uncharacterized protein (DUF2062 family)
MKVQYLRMVRRAFRALRHKNLRHRSWWRTISKPLYERCLWVPCRDTVASGLAIGLFFSMMLMPFQMLPAAMIAMRVRANVPIAMAACWLTNPVTAGPIMYLQYRVGKWMREVLGFPMPDFLIKVHFDVPGAGDLNAASYILGMISAGVILALCAYPLVHVFSAILPHHLPVRSRRIKSQAKAAGGVAGI